LTAPPAPSLTRRDAPTEPVHCIYDFGLAVTTQGAKQIMLGDKVFNYGPGESMLAPIDLPIRSVHSKSIWSAADVRSYPAMPLHVNSFPISTGR